MWLGVTDLAPPAAEPITVEEARAQCKIDGTGQDAELSCFILAARGWVEHRAELYLINRPVELRATRWTDLRRLPVAPLQQVQSIATQVGDADPVPLEGLEQRLGGIFPSFVPASTSTWPQLPTGALIVIRAVAGYGETPAEVPDLCRMAIKLLVGAMNDNRGAIPDDAERSAFRLIRPFCRDTV